MLKSGSASLQSVLAFCQLRKDLEYLLRPPYLRICGSWQCMAEAWEAVEKTPILYEAEGD